MLARQPTEAEAREVFEDLLASYAAGDNPGIISCYGIDTEEIIAALYRVGEAAPNPPVELLDAARAAFNNRHAVASRRQHEILHQA
ncbi:hypothetical protein [Mycolicibacterium sarraceniae]|nr:hypothetical protein [Mycolicibacterium sarraceniae]